MKFGVLADIHGNITALLAVLRECEEKGIVNFILLGDLYAKGSSPYRVYEELQKLNIMVSIRGNTDEWIIQGGKDDREQILCDYVRKEITASMFVSIKHAKAYQWLEGKDTLILLTHELLKEQRTELFRQYGIDRKPDVIISAHTHYAKREFDNGIWYLNPGSVGLSYDSNSSASYGILDLTSPENMIVKRIAYDIQKEVNLAKKSGVPYLENYIQTLEKGEKQDVAQS